MKNKIEEFLNSESVKLFEKAIFYIADYPTRASLTNMFNGLKDELGSLVIDEQVKEVTEDKVETQKPAKKRSK